MRMDGAIVACAVAGAAVGFSVGFLSGGEPGWSLMEWIRWRAADAALWSALGAVAVSSSVYAWARFSRRI